MSKRCKLQKEFYKEFGNYKGEGKYSDYYVKWLEDKIMELIPTPTTEEVNKFLDENYPTESICRRGGCSNVKKEDKTYCTDCSYEKIMTGY
mgnify:CR=1 FL=1